MKKSLTLCEQHRHLHPAKEWDINGGKATEYCFACNGIFLAKVSDKTTKITQYGCIYVITNLLNNTQYVGQTRQGMRNRWRMHKNAALSGNSGTALHSAIREFGWKNFDIRLLEDCPIDQLHITERKWIAVLGTMLPYGYNMPTVDFRRFEFNKRILFANRHKLTLRIS